MLSFLFTYLSFELDTKLKRYKTNAVKTIFPIPAPSHCVSLPHIAFPYCDYVCSIRTHISLFLHRATLHTTFLALLSSADSTMCWNYYLLVHKVLQFSIKCI